MNASKIYEEDCLENCDYFIDEYWIASEEDPVIAGDDGTGIDALGTSLATND